MTEPKKELRAGRYVLVRSLGEGSQGETFEAIDNGPSSSAPTHPTAPAKRRALVDQWQHYVREAKAGAKPPKIANGLVAIKAFRVGKAKTWKDVELAEREATTLRSLDHPKLPRYIEHFEEDGTLYLVMEKIEGESLAELRKQRRQFRPDEVTRMLEDAADALRYLHHCSPPLIHRDIKPGNVIRRADGSFAIVDFGSVRDRLKPAGGSTVVGTFGYMAPEQFQGRASPQSDVYGVAATALVMLTGEEPEDLPHQGLAIDVARAVPRGTPLPLIRALSAMLDPDPDRRATSIDEALGATKPGAGGVRSGDRRDSRAPRDSRRTKHEERKARQRERREQRRERRDARREARRGWRVPFLPLVVMRLGIFVAMLVVGIIVGLLVPLVLTLLSVVFGEPLRRAAAACRRDANATQKAMARAAAWIGGEPSQDAQLRVAEDRARVRVAPADEAEEEPEDAGEVEEEEPLKEHEPELRRKQRRT